MMDHEKIKEGVRLILEGIGEDVAREGLLETPDRIAKMCEEICGGLTEDAGTHLRKQFSVENNNMVLEKDITFYSICEHHLLPFYGKAHVAYIPNGRVAGLSKLARTVEVFAKELFGPETKTKFRPHHFPFTEPSAEVDVTCFKCGGKGCRFCKGSGWIEILGCGMVHPHVLEMCGIDPEEYSGFAFGVGLERIALLKYEIDDMRLLYENDIRFLKQF